MGNSASELNFKVVADKDGVSHFSIYDEKYERKLFAINNPETEIPLMIQALQDHLKTLGQKTPEWLPIEKAPLAQHVLLGWSKTGHMEDGYIHINEFSNSRFHLLFDGESLIDEPDYFMDFSNAFKTLSLNPANGGWRPIDQAPLERCIILGWSKGGHVEDGDIHINEHSGERQHILFDGESSRTEPDFFMNYIPLPGRGATHA